MRELHHPHTGRPVRVPDADADRWIAAGWVDPNPTIDDPADGPETIIPDAADAESINRKAHHG